MIMNVIRVDLYVSKTYMYECGMLDHNAAALKLDL